MSGVRLPRVEVQAAPAHGQGARVAEATGAGVGHDARAMRAVRRTGDHGPSPRRDRGRRRRTRGPRAPRRPLPSVPPRGPRPGATWMGDHAQRAAGRLLAQRGPGPSGWGVKGVRRPGCLAVLPRMTGTPPSGFTPGDAASTRRSVPVWPSTTPNGSRSRARSASPMTSPPACLAGTSTNCCRRRNVWPKNSATSGGLANSGSPGALAGMRRDQARRRARLQRGDAR